MNETRTRIGSRNKLIEIRTPTQGTDPISSQPIETCTVFTRAWSAKIAHSGRAFWQAQQRHAEVSEVFNIAYISGVTPRMQVVHAGVTYQIIDVDDLGGRAEINLACKGLV
jgi:SPP1 family predicted phage head-tail adaptor